MSVENSSNVDISPDAKPVFDSHFLINLSFEDVYYSIGGNEILSHISGRAIAGRTLGIIGGSGSGKTMLLKALSGRLGSVRSSVLTGKIRLNEVLYKRQYRQLIGYVPQEDIIGAMSTPRTALRFALRTRLGVDNETADQSVSEVIELLKLQDCRNTIVGIPGLIQGLSGGERKRTNIGMELIADTRLLLCDEPTSGLDSTTALRVVRTLQDIARSGRTVVFSVHQPTAEMLMHFDDLLLLTAGRVAYHGPMDRAVAYFECIGYRCPETFTPTDYFMVLLQNISIAPVLAEQWQRFLALNNVVISSAVNLGDGYTDENDLNETDKTFKRVLGDGVPDNVLPYPTCADPEQTETASYIGHYLSKKGSNYSVQAWELMKRSFIFVYTDRMYIIMAFAQVIVFSLITAIIFVKLKDSVTGIQDRLGLIFMLVINICFTHSSLSLNRFKSVKALYIREQQCGSYSPFLFWLTTFLADIPLMALVVMLNAIIVYFIAQFYMSAAAFFYFYAVIFIMSQCAFSIGCLIGSAVSNDVIATLILPMVSVHVLLCAGLLATNDQIRPYWIWLEKISYVRYGFLLLFHNEFSRLGKISCDPTKIPNCPLQPKVGPDVISSLNFDDEQDAPWVMWISAACFLVLMRMLQLIALYVIARKKN